MHLGEHDSPIDDLVRKLVPWLQPERRADRLRDGGLGLGRQLLTITTLTSGWLGMCSIVSNFLTYVTAPASAGTYYYGLCVDAVTGESDTTNNCSGSASVEVTE